MGSGMCCTRYGEYILGRGKPSSYEQLLFMDHNVRKLTGGLGMMSRLVSKVIQCVRSVLKYYEEIVYPKCGSRLLSRLGKRILNINLCEETHTANFEIM